MQTLYEEAERSADANAAAFFRTGAGTARPESADTKKDNIKWNGKFTSTGRPCVAFNSGFDHKPSQLLPDGTCKGNH